MPREATKTRPPVLARSCHEILNAAAALAIDVEFLGSPAVADDVRQDAARDVRASVARIAEVARAMQSALREASFETEQADLAAE